MQLSCRNLGALKRKICDVFVRFMGGDLSLIAAASSATPAFSFCNGWLSLRGEDVPILYYADTDEVWLRAKQIHTFTGATKIGQTLDRVDEGDKYSLKELIRRKGTPPRVGTFNVPPPDPEESTQGNATKGWYVEQPNPQPRGIDARECHQGVVC